MAGTAVSIACSVATVVATFVATFVANTVAVSVGKTVAVASAVSEVAKVSTTNSGRGSEQPMRIKSARSGVRYAKAHALKWILHEK